MSLTKRLPYSTPCLSSSASIVTHDLQLCPAAPISPTRPQLPAMASQDTDLLPENTSGYKLSQPKQTLEQYQNMGKSDERGSWAAGFLSSWTMAVRNEPP